ncbi:MAG: HupE/UreJ family protein, partial [Janthinobacterium lividum]
MRAPMAFLLACLASTPALAHQMPKSAVLLDVRSREVQAELQLPIDRLQVALHHDGSGVPAPDAAAMLDAQRGRVEAYVLSHIHASGRGDVPWTISLQGMNEQVLEGDPALVVHLVLRPPSGAPANALDLHYDVITRELVTHAALVSVRSDWKSGVAPDSPELVGAIGGHMTHLMVDRTGGTAWRGFRSIFMLGMNHIAEGTDHLLFLLTLLLPAPLCAVCGRWRRAGRPAHSVLQIAKIVSAFTVGHSVT